MKGDGKQGAVTEKLYLTVKEAGHLISASRSTVYAMIARGALKPVKLGPGRSMGVRIPMTEIQRLGDMAK